MTTPTQKIFNQQVHILTRLAAVIETQNEIFIELQKANEAVLIEYRTHLNFLKEMANAQSSSQDDNGSPG